MAYGKIPAFVRGLIAVRRKTGGSCGLEYFPRNPKTYQFQKRQKLASDKTEKSSRLPGFQPIITVIGGNCYDRCVFGSGL